MFRKAPWILTLGLLAILAGCGDDAQRKVVRHLPPPATPAPPPRIDKPPAPPPLTAVRPTLPSLRGKKIVIDAGHGGKDPGTWKGTLSKLPEKTIVLLIANEVARLLQDRGATVINTRSTDRFLELDDRAAIAQRNQVNLFVAIHADSAANRSASGSTVYITKATTGASFTAARDIQHGLSAAGIECRGIRRANYRVLVAHSRPAVLVECGYLTNAGDAGRLNTQTYRSKVAAAIARGIADYLSRR